MKSVVIAFALLFSLSYASRASANECGGTLIDYKPVWNNGQKVGELALYYNSANGNNCAVFNHAGPTWGVRLHTVAEVYVCKTVQADDCAVFQWSPWWSRDDAWYAYRAGPVRVYGRGMCVKAMGYVDFRGTSNLAVTGKHCQ